MLTQETIETIKSTVPLLEKNGRLITDTFYGNLFLNHPFLKNIFNKANQSKGDQSRALSDAVLAYAKNIDNVDLLGPVVERIAHKHASLGVQAKHYDVVGETLLSAIQEVLSLPDDHATLVAWAEAYGVLAKIFIDAEKAIYQTNRNQYGGWAGYRDFFIERIVDETPEVKSFYLKPMDLEAIPGFSAGQYVGVRTKPDKTENFQVRQYSLSQKSTCDALRISVKAEPNGAVSNYLHTCKTGDAVSIQAPTGVFTLSSRKPKHIFVTGGVGITPLFSMLEEAINSGVNGNDILFIQCAKDKNNQIFKEDLYHLKTENKFHHKVCYENTDEGDYEGYLKQEILEEWTKGLGFSKSNSQVYFCGPKPFMAVLNQFFERMNYASENIHYEVFGPTTSL